MTRFTQLSVGTTIVAIAATMAGYFGGKLGVRDSVDFVNQNGTQTGVVLQVEGTTQFQVRTTACTNTGGLAKYPTCLVRSPLSTTGALTAVTLECGNTNKALVMSGGFVKSTTASITTGGFPTLNDVTVGSGSITAFNPKATSGSYTLWNPADLLKFQTITAMPAGGINCVVRTELHDKHGS